MSAYQINPVAFGSHQALQVAHASGTSVLLALRGATLLHWKHPVSGRLVDLLDGYATAEELESQAGVRNGILAPFSNRIADARYSFDGASQDLLPGTPPAERLVYHGLVRTVDFDVAETRVEDGRAVVVLSTDTLRPGRFDGYPHAVDVTVTYTVTPDSISVHVRADNVGIDAAPYGSGWHPYFRLLGKAVDELHLQVPARSVVVTDDSLIPLAGDAGVRPLERGDELEFRSPRRLGALVLDTCYADLTADDDGIIRTRMSDPSSGASLTVWQERGLMHVFTGDTLARGPRRSLALEPVELPTDAFNDPGLGEQLTLAPGAGRDFAFGVTASLPDWTGTS